MTAGTVEEYERLVDEDITDNYVLRWFVIEGTYNGYSSSVGGAIDLMLDDISVLAGECGEYLSGESAVIEHDGTEEENPYSIEYFNKLNKGTRILLIGYYFPKASNIPHTAIPQGLSKEYNDEKIIRVLDGAEDNYLETEEFAYYKKLIHALNQDKYIYDIVYTSDMRAIPRFNERKMLITQGRLLTVGDKDVCVVNEDFLQAYNLSIGDTISIQLGDRLFHQDPVFGAQSGGDIERVSDFEDMAELKIIGAYRFTDDADSRVADSAWSYSINSIFVLETLFTATIPTGYETADGEFSVLIESPHDIEAFEEAARDLTVEMGVTLYFSDAGWLDIKDSLETGDFISFLALVLYVIGAALAMKLASYLYIGRNTKTYAIMRALGTPVRTIERSLAIPLVVLSILAMPVGGVMGLFYASKAIKENLNHVLAAMSDKAFVGYVQNTVIPMKVILGCLFFELLFISGMTWCSLQKIKKISVLELLQRGTYNPGNRMRIDMIEDASIPANFDLARVSVAKEVGTASNGKYNSFCHVIAYVVRHMWRSKGKTMVSLVLSIVLSAGIGMFALEKNAYHEAYEKVAVKATTYEFGFPAILELSDSKLVKEFYCYNTFSVRVNNHELHTPMISTNDIRRYLGNECEVIYESGYDISALETIDPVCLMGKELAEMLDVELGDEILITVSKVFLHVMLACKWRQHFMTRPTMRMKWGECPMRIRIVGELWECVARNNSCNQDSGVLTPESILLLSDTRYAALTKVLSEEFDDEEMLNDAVKEEQQKYKVIGIVDSVEESEDKNISIFANIKSPVEEVNGQSFEYAYSEFELADNRELNKLNDVLTEQVETYRATCAPKASFYIDDATFEDVVRMRSLLDSLFPIAVATVVLIGLLGSGLMVLQSSKEASLLRILGSSRRRVRIMLILEQVLLCIAGIMLALGIIVLYNRSLFQESVETMGICFALYFMSCVFGAFGAAAWVTKGRLLELLQTKE